MQGYINYHSQFTYRGRPCTYPSRLNGIGGFNLTGVPVANISPQGRGKIKMKYLSDYMQEAQTELFESTGSFFAFGNKQFNEAKKPNVKYVSLGAGLICPKHNVKTLMKGLEKIHKNSIKQDVQENGHIKIIEREFFNHESQITRDYSNAMEALSGHIKEFPELFTNETIAKIFSQCLKLAIEKDFF